MDDPNLTRNPSDPSAKQRDLVQEALENAAAKPPPREFTGASTQSLAGAMTNPLVTEHPMAVNQGVASADPPQGGMDENIPVSRGNQHLVLGKRVAEE